MMIRVGHVKRAIIKTWRGNAEHIMNRKEPPKKRTSSIKIAEHESQNKQRRDKRAPVRSSGVTRIDLKSLVEELKTHQVELEIQNEELRKAQQELNTTQAKYSDLYDFAPVGYFTFNSRGIIASVNITGAEMVGRAKNRLINTPFSRYVADKDLDSFYTHLRTTFQTQKKQTGEILLRRADKSVFPVKIQSAPPLDSSIRSADCLSVVTDISELKEASVKDQQMHLQLRLLNAELDAERSRWQGVVEGIADEVWVCDIQGRMSLMNLRAVTEMGLEEFKGKSVMEVLEEVDIFYPNGQPRPPEQAPLLRSLKGEVVRGEEIMRHKKTGWTRHRQFSSAPTRDASGAITGAVAIARDITEMRLAEEALRDSEARMNALAATALDSIILIDNDGAISFWNEAAARMFGYTREEVIGKKLHDLIMPERHRQVFLMGFEAFRSTGTGPMIGKVYETEARKKDGTEFPVELSLASLKLKDKWCSIGILRDITERKQSEENLQKAMDELARSNEELDQFASIASHDLKAPLRTITSYLELFTHDYKDRLNEEASQYIVNTVNASRRMSELIDALYAYSRIRTRAKEFATIEMGSALKQAIENVGKDVEDAHAEITSAELPRVEGDNAQLVQLLQNLIGNAIKFRKKEEQPRIRVSAKKKGTDWVFGVHDNGIGIEPVYFDRIFIIFRRLHATEEYPGTGIGLALCKKIVERHGGHIWVESIPGEGSSFYFTLPIGKF